MQDYRKNGTPNRGDMMDKDMRSIVEIVRSIIMIVWFAFAIIGISFMMSVCGIPRVGLVLLTFLNYTLPIMFAYNLGRLISILVKQVKF